METESVKIYSNNKNFTHTVSGEIFCGRIFCGRILCGVIFCGEIFSGGIFCVGTFSGGNVFLATQKSVLLNQ